MKKISIFLALILVIGIFSGFSAFANNTTSEFDSIIPLRNYTNAQGGTVVTGNNILAYCSSASAHDNNGHELHAFAHV